MAHIYPTAQPTDSVHADIYVVGILLSVYVVRRVQLPYVRKIVVILIDAILSVASSTIDSN